MSFPLYLNEIGSSMVAFSELLSFLVELKRRGEVGSELISFPVAGIIGSKCRKVKLAIS